MTRTRLRFNNRAEWLEARKDGIGASEVATIVGLNPYDTPYQLWRRKIGLDAPKEENFAMKAGHYLEDAVARFYADESGREIIKSSDGDFMFVDANKPFLRVSPDRTFWLSDMTRNDNNKGVLECKTTQKTIDPDDLPKTWFCQVQMNLGVAGYEQGSIAWLTAGREFGWRDITFSPDFYGWLVEEVERFWIDNILGKKEPIATNVRDVLLKFNRHVDGKQIEVGDDLFNVYSELKEIKEELAKLDTRKEELEGQLKMAFKDAEKMTYAGETIATWKASKPSMKLDTKLLLERYPNIAEEVTHPAQGVRRLLLK